MDSLETNARSIARLRSHLSMQAAEQTRALLMAQRARIPIYVSMLQVAIVSIAIPSALGLQLLAGLGGAIFLCFWITVKAVDHSLIAYRVASHCVYFLSLITLSYAVLGLEISGNMTVYSTATILLGAAYLLGTRPALFWSIPCLLLVASDALLSSEPQVVVPPIVTFVVRAGTLGTILAFAVSFRWAHDQQATKLQIEARLDALTGLSNRRAFEDALTQALGRAKRFGRRGALIFADLDGMKMINDTLGHQAGDEFLAEIGSRIQALTRIIDTPARLGGDEFVILVSEFADPKGAETLGRRLCETISRPWRFQDQEIRPAASIGIVEFDPRDQDPRELMRRADEAMYAAKRSESAQICVDRGGEIHEVN